MSTECNNSTIDIKLNYSPIAATSLSETDCGGCLAGSPHSENANFDFSASSSTANNSIHIIPERDGNKDDREVRKGNGSIEISKKQTQDGDEDEDDFLNDLLSPDHDSIQKDEDKDKDEDEDDFLNDLLSPDHDSIQKDEDKDKDEDEDDFLNDLLGNSDHDNIHEREKGIVKKVDDEGSWDDSFLISLIDKKTVSDVIENMHISTKFNSNNHDGNDYSTLNNNNKNNNNNRGRGSGNWNNNGNVNLVTSSENIYIAESIEEQKLKNKNTDTKAFTSRSNKGNVLTVRAPGDSPYTGNRIFYFSCLLFHLYPFFYFASYFLSLS